jgi:nicotinate-nucleotide adenylyltransferase
MKPELNCRRVAFFGGSFDPPHLGHLAVARAARAALRLDTVLFAPVGAQPLKPSGSTASFEDRLAMTRLAIAGEPGFEVSLADAPKTGGKPNYTLETLRALREKMPGEGESFCLMGADSFFGLKGWHGAAEIPFAASLIVASRPGERPAEWMEGLRAALPAGLTIEPVGQGSGGVETELQTYTLHDVAGQSAALYLLPGLHWDISASDIRGQIRELVGEDRAGLPERDRLLPEAVFDYIKAHELYR